MRLERWNPYVKSPMIGDIIQGYCMGNPHYLCCNLLQHILGSVVMSFEHEKITYIDIPTMSGLMDDAPIKVISA
jgi:hypothetical protein